MAAEGGVEEKAAEVGPTEMVEWTVAVQAERAAADALAQATQAKAILAAEPPVVVSTAAEWMAALKAAAARVDLTVAAELGEVATAAPVVVEAEDKAEQAALMDAERAISEASLGLEMQAEEVAASVPGVEATTVAARYSTLHIPCNLQSTRI